MPADGLTTGRANGVFAVRGLSPRSPESNCKLLRTHGDTVARESNCYSTCRREIWTALLATVGAFGPATTPTDLPRLLWTGMCTCLC